MPSPIAFSSALNTLSPLANRARIWREPALANAELLRAAYRAHQFPPHAHDEYAIGFIERGGQAYTRGGKERLIIPVGTICVINPGQLHEGRGATEAGWDYRMIYFPSEVAAMVLADVEPVSASGLPFFAETVIDDPDTLQALYAAHVCSESSDASQLEKASRLIRALRQLMTRHGQGVTRVQLPRAADLLGKEDAVYMVTGTMTNQVAIRAHTEPGDAVLFDQNAHVYILEGGAPAAYAGVLPRLLPGVRGIFNASDVEAAIGVPHRFFPATIPAPVRLLCLENTHHIGGGKVWPLEQLKAVCDAGRERGVKRHLDGARLWHATAATGIAESEYARHFDSVSVCFSKGLGAPVGSALAGSREFITRARRFKQQMAVVSDRQGSSRPVRFMRCKTTGRD